MSYSKRNPQHSISTDEDEVIPFGYKSARDLAFNKRDEFDLLVEQTQKYTQSQAQTSQPEKKAPLKPKAPPIDSHKEELKQLYQSLYEEDKKYEKAKGKRTNITILFFAIVYLVIILVICGKTDIIAMVEAVIMSFTNIWSFIGIIIGSFVLSWIHFWVNSTIFWQLSQKSREENERLENIKKQISELEKHLSKGGDAKNNRQLDYNNRKR